MWHTIPWRSVNLAQRYLQRIEYYKPIEPTRKPLGSTRGFFCADTRLHSLLLTTELSEAHRHTPEFLSFFLLPRGKWFFLIIFYGHTVSLYTVYGITVYSIKVSMYMCFLSLVCSFG